MERKKADAARLQQQMVALQEQLSDVGAVAERAAAALHEAGASGLQVGLLNRGAAPGRLWQTAQHSARAPG